MTDFRDLLKSPKHDIYEEKIGRATSRNIDKTGVFYHVITRTANGENHFLSRGFGEYRHNLLCRLCEDRGITVVFSLTMPNHTHDDFLTPSWEALSETMKGLDANAVKYLRYKEKEKLSKYRSILRRCTVYIVVRETEYLFNLGKYIFDNPAFLRAENKFVPYDCFWMFRTGHFLDAYDEKLYKKVFGLDPQQLYGMYSSMTKKEISAYSKETFPAGSSRGLFYRA